MAKNILVTGAGGFIGREVCGELERRGHKAVAATRQGNTSGIVASCQVSVGAIDAATDWTRALVNCDTVLHLAARAHILNDKSSDPLTEFRKTNVEGTLNLAKCAAASGVRRFIFVSSIGVHGKPRGKPFRASDVPDPVDDYAVSKFEAELALRSLELETGMEVVIVRPPLVYGPDCPGNFRRLIRLIELGLPLPFGKIHGRRSFVSIWNLVDFLITCVTHSSAAGGTYIVSDAEDVTLPDLLRLLADKMGKPIRLFSISESFLSGVARLLGKSRLYEKLCGELTVDISDTCRTLQWHPPVNQAVGLTRTAQSFLRQR